MEVIKLTLGELSSNAYIVKKDSKVLIIDPGSQAEVILSHINKDDKVLAILLTHGHFDHIGAVNDVLDVYNVDVYASLNEKQLLEDKNMSFYDGIINKDIIYFTNDLKIDNFDIKVHHTPGHTAGSVMFEIKNYMFSGDTIFKESIGRMDLPSGSQSDMQKSLDYIKSFKNDYIVCPGHGLDTTLYLEFKNNPYLR